MHRKVIIFPDIFSDKKPKHSSKVLHQFLFVAYVGWVVQKLHHETWQIVDPHTPIQAPRISGVEHVNYNL